MKGTITAGKQKGLLAGKSLSVLVNLIRQGRIYCNAHSEQHPNGEIRGQVVPLLR